MSWFLFQQEKIGNKAPTNQLVVEIKIKQISQIRFGMK